MQTTNSSAQIESNGRAEQANDTDLRGHRSRPRTQLGSDFMKAVSSRRKSLLNLHKHFLLGQKQVLEGVMEVIDSEIELADDLAETPRPRRERIEID